MVYPILQVLLYIALLFAGPNIDRISISGPDVSLDLVRQDDGWRAMEGNDSYPVWLDKDFVATRKSGEEAKTAIAGFVQAARDHDWSAGDKVKLPYNASLEKTSENSYVLRVAEGKNEAKEYRITFYEKGEKLSVNVLGAVKNPGHYTLDTPSPVGKALDAANG